MTDKISISFDEDNRIRVLEADKFKLTDNLKNESMDFMKKIINFEETISQLNEILEQEAQKIEQEKLKALGERNKVESEEELRKKRVIEFNTIFNEKKSELERYNIEYESLLRIEAEQKQLIEKLSNNEA